MFRRMMPALAGWLALLTCGSAWSSTVLETSELLAATPEAAAQLPPAYEFTLTEAGDYAVTLTDTSSGLNPDARLESLEVLVIRDLQAVAKFEVQYPTQPDGTMPSATRTFAGTPGTYRVHVLGRVPQDEGAGAFSIEVAPSAGGAPVLDQFGSISAEGGPGPNQSTLQVTFTAPTAGTYELVFTDRGFPAALAQRQILLLRYENGAPLPVLDPLPGQFAATAANQMFELIIIATAGTQQAGLYSVRVESPTDTVVYSSDNIVGRLPPAKTIDIPSTNAYSLTLTDLVFPEALTSMSAAVIQNGAFVGSRTGAGSSNLALTQGTAQLYVFNVAPTIGAMSATVTRGASAAYADIHIADASPDANTPSIYSFTPSQPVAAGNYALTVSDFRFPSQLASAKTLVAQRATVVDKFEQPGADTVALQAGPVRVLIAVTPPAASGTMPGNGMFALTLTTQPANAVVFESTQGVGGLFNVRELNLPAAGRYDVTLKDFEFPERLRTSWLVITSGTRQVGQVIGSSTITNLQLDAGIHVLNFLGQPAANELFGAYGMKVSDSTPPPTVRLTASPASITSGQGTTLEWSTTDATSCTASGGWTGSKEATGRQPISGLTANTTFDIECVGAGGRDDASVTVSVNAPSPGGGGGGGGYMNVFLLLSLAALLSARLWRSRRSLQV
ncbi:MAG: hypothetical protein ABW171_06225 [Steroidobacter sp.]